MPKPVRQALQRFVSLDRLKMEHFARERAQLGAMPAGFRPQQHSPRVGVLTNRAQYHRYHAQACVELGLDFTEIDLLRHDWLQAVQADPCDVYVAWPDATLTSTAKVVKDRLDLMESELGSVVWPERIERWLYEDKQRLAEWLSAVGAPHPRTWVFIDPSEALDFSSRAETPVVVKTSFGAAASGVRVVRDRRRLQSVVREVFGRGVAAGGHDYRDRQRGVLIVQEYVDVAREWRIVRAGARFMSRLKAKVGDYHSGSGLVSWAEPDPSVLDLVEAFTGNHGLRFVAVDVFETADGALLINEVQAVVGPILVANTSRGEAWRGWWLRDASTGEWRFVRGEAYRNAAANERVAGLLESMGHGGSIVDGVLTIECSPTRHQGRLP